MRLAFWRRDEGSGNQEREPQSTRARPRVLVVGSNAASREQLRRTLEAAGQTVVTLGPSAGTASLASDPLNVVVVNYELGEGALCAALISELRDRLGGVPIVMLLPGALVTRSTEPNVLTMGADYVLAKPLQPDDVRRAVEAIVTGTRDSGRTIRL